MTSSYDDVILRHSSDMAAGPDNQPDPKIACHLGTYCFQGY